MFADRGNPDVRRGEYVLTVGLDLTGKLKEGKELTFPQVREAIQSSSLLGNQRLQTMPVSLPPVDKDDSTKLHEQYSIDSLRPPWLWNLDINEYEKLLESEYFLKSAVGPSMHDELLYRNLVRKASLLTEKGRRGLVTIKLLEVTDLDVFKLLPQDRNQGIRPHARLRWEGAEGSKEGGDFSKAEWVVPPVSKRFFKAKLQMFLNLTLEEREDEYGTGANKEERFNHARVGRVGTMTLVIEPDPGSNVNFFEFLTDSHSLHVGLTKDKEAKNYVLRLNDAGNINISSVTQHYVEQDGIPLFDFLVALAWLFVVRQTRKEIFDSGMEENKAEYSQRFLSSEQFADRLHELREYISFSYSVASIGHEWVEYLNNVENLQSANPDFLGRMSELLGLVDWVGSESGAQRYLRDVGRRSFLLGRTTILCPPNRAVALSDWQLFPQKLRSSGVLDYSEWGTRWGVSWAMLWEVMLCSLAETFLLYNEEIERHVKKEGETSELGKLTRRAFRDFATYYDVDIIQSQIFRYEFELAKDIFGINNYHRILRERLDLFSSYEIAETNSRINRRLGYLTIVLVAIGVLTLLLRFA
jgi:hypothetical protein